MSKSFRYILIFVLSIFVAGCTTYNAATGRNEFIFIPTEEEIAMGKVTHQQLLLQHKLLNDPVALSRIQRVGNRLAQVSDRQDYAYHFYVIDANEMNAFTTPGGNIYFYSGLLNKMKTDDEIAGVLSHEIGHCAARHTIKKFQAALGYNIIGGIIINQVVKDDTAKIAALGTNAVMSLVFSAYSRGDELQADQLGIKYMYLAGYDPQGMIKTFEILKQETKDEGPPLILRSHPYLEDRIKQAEKEIEVVKEKYKE